MSKREFLDSLSRALTGKVEAAEVSQHIAYYSDYIDKEVRLGRSEEEVIRELGDPRLLVKSIVNAENAATERMGWGSRNAEFTYEAEEEAASKDDAYGMANIPKVVPWWLILLIILMVVFALIISLISAVGSLLSLLFGRFLTPIVILLLIWYLYTKYNR